MQHFQKIGNQKAVKLSKEIYSKYPVNSRFIAKKSASIDI